MDLSAKQAAFVAEYLVDKNATQAATRAGYSAKTAYSQGQRLLKNVEVKKKLSEALTAQIVATGITAERVLRELGRLGFSDLRTLFTSTGALKPIHSLSDDEAACLASVEVVKKNLTTGDDIVDDVIKLKIWDKPRSLEMLAKHFALLTERVEHGGNVTFGWKNTEE